MKRLVDGNRHFVENSDARMRHHLTHNGQHPYAVVLTCADSRVIPEKIFHADLGDLFVIRIAGNVIDDHQLGSIEYAVEHLGSKEVILLGHTHCGAVAAALEGHARGYVASIINDIQSAIGEERDPDQASRLNVLHGVQRIKEALPGMEMNVRGAVYDIERGTVDWIDNPPEA